MMDWLTADDINAFVDFIAVCMLILCFIFGWIAGSYR